jgi:hypothetical protein
VTSIAVLFSHLSTRLSSCILHSDLPIKILYTFLISFLCSAHPTYIILLDFINLIIFINTQLLRYSSCYSFLLGLDHSVLSNSQSLVFFNVRDEVSVHRKLQVQSHILPQNPLLTSELRNVRCEGGRGLISLWLYKENNKLPNWKKFIYSTYSPLSTTRLWFRCSNFPNP